MGHNSMRVQWSQRPPHQGNSTAGTLRQGNMLLAGKIDKESSDIDRLGAKEAFLSLHCTGHETSQVCIKEAGSGIIITPV